MGFNPTNSARAIAQSLTDWKSRELNMSSRHRGTINFGDICPLYWAFTLPKDKISADSSGIFKFFPLIAPAMVDCKVQFDWFWVPLKLIAPLFRNQLQNWEPESVSKLTKQITNQFNPVSGFAPAANDYRDNDTNFGLGYTDEIYPPSLPAYIISMYLSDYPVNTFYESGNVFPVLPDNVMDRWRCTSSDSYDGMEAFSSIGIYKRNSKLMSYLGLPKLLTNIKFNANLAPFGTISSETYFVSVDTENFTSPNLLSSEFKDYFSSFSSYNYHHVNEGSHAFSGRAYYYILASVYNRALPPGYFTFNASGINVSTGFSYNYPFTNSTAPISLLPFQAYQTIYNKFYRDQKIMKDEIRTYTNYSFKPTKLTYPQETFRAYPVSVYPINHNGISSHVDRIFFNNLFGLRRKNYAKDLFSTCYPDSTILVNNSTDALTSSNVSLLSKFRKFLLKKEMTGSDFFQWLNNFFGTRGADYLTDNVVHLGSHESQVVISENIQNSESSTESAQGNRAGLANSYHNDRKVYFECPDFGILMCNVTLIPDFPTNYNGLDSRWSLVNPIDWNFVDLQNIGFTTIYNQNINFGFIERTEDIAPYLTGKSSNETAFGYQPFGFAWTYQPDIISGDLQRSLKFWHQSPDYSDRNYTHIDDFTKSFYPTLNFNYPAIGRQFEPVQDSLWSSTVEQYYNNIFAVTNDESGDHCVFDIKFDVKFHRKTAFFTDGLPESN